MRLYKFIRATYSREFNTEKHTISLIGHIVDPKHRRWRLFQKNLTNDELNDINERFVPNNDDCFNETIFREAITVKDEALESLI